MPPTPSPSVWRSIPPSIWALGFVSMLMDVSSEMIHALLPVYMVSVLGASALTVGIVEGIAEATASITKIFSGALSDWLGKRKLLAVIGYGLAAFSKPIFPLVSSVGWLVAARFIDRVGKGIRGAPRDALLTDISPEHLRGASFGLRQSLDTIGAFVGPLLAIGLMAYTANTYTTVFWVAVIPAFLSLGFMMFAVHEPVRAPTLRKVTAPLSMAELRTLSGAFWRVVIIGSVFTLARFSEAFLILRAQSLGVPVMLVPGVLVVMNVVYALAAYPIGVLSDRMNRTTLLALGMAVLIVADLTLPLMPNLTGLGVGVVLWGLHMGLTQGLLSAMVADAAPAELRGTAFGMFNVATGVAMLLASVVAGALWDSIGPNATFMAGAGFAGLSLIGLKALSARQ